MKDIVKNDVMSKLLRCNFTKLWEYFLYTKKTKITTLFNNSSPPRHRSVIFEYPPDANSIVLCQLSQTEKLSTFIVLNENSISMWCGWHRTAYAICVHYGDTEETNCWIKLFLFSWCTNSILVASSNYGWTTDVTWIILTISLLRFWALIVYGSLLSMGGSERSQISSEIS